MRNVRTEHADVVIVGAGVAGLTTALELLAQGGSERQRIVVLSKAALGTGAATAWAQGGIAAAMGSDDSPALHAADTLAAAGGIGDADAVKVLTSEASERIAAVMRLGAQFDRTADGAFALGREGAHGRRRILHVGGDTTGRALLDALVRAARMQPAIRVVEQATALDLVRSEGRVIGVLADVAGSRCAFIGRAVVLATGGIGALYACTTNPLDACGEGLATAMRAGAVLSDLEFVQFHPTALDVGRDPMPLLTEALRGEGAAIVDERGERFLQGVHPLAELASRDVIARAVYERRRGGGRVFLDARAIASFASRFPTAEAACRAAGIDPCSESIPIAPAAHYHMGGIAVDAWGRSSLPGLWACGEVAATGVHGANRLASNSLLEGLVFAGRVARDVAGTSVVAGSLRDAESSASHGAPALMPEAIARLRRAMDENVGVVRDHEGLCAAIDEIDAVSAGAPLANRAIVSRAIAQAALERCETRGSHARRDYPNPRAEYEHRSFVAPRVPAPTLRVAS
jgi:L-aspartate oxidase